MRVIFASGLLFLCIISMSICAKILGVFHMHSHSHFVLGEILLKELAKRGHEVTVISRFPQKHKINNYHDIPVYEKAAVPGNAFDLESKAILSGIIMVYKMGLDLTEQILLNENVQKLLRSEENFDLVIVEQFLNEAHMGFASHFAAPIILLNAGGSSGWNNHIVGNSAPMSYVPSQFLRYGGSMSFFMRIQNMVIETIDNIYKWTLVIPKQNKILKKYFPDSPDLYTLMYNASLIFLNSHATSNEPVPHVPSMIEIGGLHITAPKPLPKELHDYLNDAKQGVIYLSMGSILKSANFSADKRNAFVKTFSKLNLKVLWKWEEDDIPGRPLNVKVGKWLPQQDILAHPNIRVFITHGGLLSTLETIHYGVPVIGIPIFGDQITNVEKAVLKGFAVHVPYTEISEEKLTWALNEVLNNSKYKENALRISKIIRDQPLDPLDKAVCWIEYVIRHKGAPYFRSAALDLTWYQYYFVDVTFLVIIICIITFYISYIVLKKLFERKQKKGKRKTQ